MLFIDKCKELGEYGERLLKEYDYEENEKQGIDINQLTHASSKEVYWICSLCGYKWEASIHKRICPHCNTRVAPTKQNLTGICLTSYD